jgi:hypothetical protein
MKARTKAPIIVIGTFIAGLVVGILGTNYVVNQRIDKMRDLRSRIGYSEALMEVVRPNSPAQQEQIEMILQRTHDGMNRLRREWARGFYAEGDTMRARMQEVLTAEQNAALDEWLSRHQSRRRSSGDSKSNTTKGKQSGDERSDSTSQRFSDDDDHRRDRK